jgi:hypothetical protein
MSLIFNLFFFQIQVVLLVMLLAAQVSVITGTAIGPYTDDQRAQGFLGLSCKYRATRLNDESASENIGASSVKTYLVFLYFSPPFSFRYIPCPLMYLR